MLNIILFIAMFVGIVLTSIVDGVWIILTLVIGIVYGLILVKESLSVENKSKYKLVHHVKDFSGVRTHKGKKELYFSKEKSWLDYNTVLLLLHSDEDPKELSNLKEYHYLDTVEMRDLKDDEKHSNNNVVVTESSLEPRYSVNRDYSDFSSSSNDSATSYSSSSDYSD